MAKDYGIECDLQPASDGTPMVFHDEMLGRLVRASGPIAAQTPASLARLRYKGQDTHILRFADLLHLVDGRVPLLVEVKSNGRPPSETFLDKIARQARAYKGPIALMSFNAQIVAGLGRLAPTVPRGLVVGAHRIPAGLLARASRTGRGKVLDQLLGSPPPGIAFYAIDVHMLRGARAWLSRHTPDLALFSWTIRTPRERAVAARLADAPIFEGYEA
jgi:glycerophosphoryl diester phosphodiesterase